MAASPVFVAASMLFGTTVLDQVVWAAVFVLVTRALQESRPARWWAAAGTVAGVGLETKDTVAVLMLGIAVGLLCHRREVLRTPGPWIAAALALALAAPNLVWDALHGWPNLTMDRVLSRQQGGPLGSLLRFPELPLLLGGTALIGIWYFGLRWLAAPENREFRWLVPTAGVVVAVFIAGGGKVYYAAPLLVPLFAAGVTRMEAATRRRVVERGLGAASLTLAGRAPVPRAPAALPMPAPAISVPAPTATTAPTPAPAGAPAAKPKTVAVATNAPAAAAVLLAAAAAAPTATAAVTPAAKPKAAAVPAAITPAATAAISVAAAVEAAPTAAAPMPAPATPAPSTPPSPKPCAAKSASPRDLLRRQPGRGPADTPSGRGDRAARRESGADADLRLAAVVRQVADAAAALPADVPIFAGDFGEAGALAVLGPGDGLRRPVYSGHDSYTYWGPPAGSPETVLCVGKFRPDELRRFWGRVDEIAPITLPAGLTNGETAQRAAIYLCRQPRGSWAQLWPQLTHID
ncbi:glycosyltransferase family 39 protein [Catenulispora yoronensis]